MTDAIDREWARDLADENLERAQARLAFRAWEAKTLRSWLLVYGRHQEGCNAQFGRRYRCRCGWREVAERLKAEPNLIPRPDDAEMTDRSEETAT